MITKPFNKTNTNVEKYFIHPQEFKINMKRLKEELLFRCPNIDALLNEKLYYPTTKRIFNKSLSNPLNNAYNLYLSTVKALYTYDYFTYNKLLSNDIIIKEYMQLDSNNKVVNY